MISIVIVNYNGIAYLRDCFHSLAAQTWRDTEVILVDNASADGSVAYVRREFPEVKIVENQTNRGFAGGTNDGIRASSGEFIFTVNNDTITTPGCLEALARAMASDTSVGMCAPKMVFPDGRINSAGIEVALSGAAWDRGLGEKDKGQYDQPGVCVFGSCAGASLYRRAMLDDCGLFDEDFFLYMEDVDLAVRARLAGWTCRYVPDAVVYHYHGGTAPVGSDISVYFGNRNVVWYPFKDYPAPVLLLALPFIIGRSIAVIPYYTFFHGKGRLVLRSKTDAFLGVGRMIRRRGEVHRRIPSQVFLSLLNIRARIVRQSPVSPPSNQHTSRTKSS